ncbi:MAG: diacylglycerol kinase family protein [Croceibacterium sp.]
MARTPPVTWLITNAASGSNSEAAVEGLKQACADAGMKIAGHTTFPDAPVPSPQELAAAGAGVVMVYAGDGTINATISALAGWDGAILVLKGGTMNLLYHRLHGDQEVEQVIAAVARGAVQQVRRGVVHSPHGQALAGLMAGPGTSWCDVREAMRDGAVVDLAATAVKALEQSLGGATIACRDPALGRPEGYPLVMLTPQDDGIVVEAYHSESTADYLAQGWALLKRDFRQGPHTDLGTVRRLVLASTDGLPFGLLIDGEPRETGSEVELTLANCGVDLLATARHGQ